MNLKELQNMKPRVRIIDSNRYESSKELIGKELEVRVINYEDNIISVYNENKADIFWLNLSGVRFLTPLKFKGKSIAIGDEILWAGVWRTVYDYSWYDGEFMIGTVKDNNFVDCWSLKESGIKDHRTTSEPSEVEKAIKFLEDAGKIINGKIII